MKIFLHIEFVGACGIISAESCIPKFTEKLAKEGVKVKGNKIQNFKQIFGIL